MLARGGEKLDSAKSRARYKGPSGVSPLAVCDGNDGAKGPWPLTGGLIALRIPAVGTNTPSVRALEGGPIAFGMELLDGAGRGYKCYIWIIRGR